MLTPVFFRHGVKAYIYPPGLGSSIRSPGQEDLGPGRQLFGIFVGYFELQVGGLGSKLEAWEALLESILRYFRLQLGGLGSKLEAWDTLLEPVLGFEGV